ncbi:hypothetical protein EUGRSUZ_E02011 [Eucalyptus grandis]|uniref:Uncharacterized protein n=2 Tax=Eucalyptus grandis TaxID=71139 RepID=A0ACC3KWP4_EUCGR|nr:hypothetical protein EUGRSUZ_E02011 [Eucalyptus grandis]
MARTTSIPKRTSCYLLHLQLIKRTTKVKLHGITNNWPIYILLKLSTQKNRASSSHRIFNFKQRLDQINAQFGQSYWEGIERIRIITSRKKERKGEDLIIVGMPMNKKKGNEANEFFHIWLEKRSGKESNYIFMTILSFIIGKIDKI